MAPFLHLGRDRGDLPLRARRADDPRPSRANARAHARPTPRPAPVTRTTRVTRPTIPLFGATASPNCGARCTLGPEASHESIDPRSFSADGRRRSLGFDSAANPRIETRVARGVPSESASRVHRPLQWSERSKPRRHGRLHHRKPANATTEGRFWARLTGGNTLAGFDNIRASCCNLDRSQSIRTLSLRTKLATSDKAQYPDVRFWTLNEVLEIRIERDDLAAALKKPATYSHHPPGTDDVTAWRALYVVLRAVAEDESWDSFATEAMDSSLTPRGEYPAAVELTLRADSSPDEVRRSLTAPFERLTKQFAAIGRVSHECGVDPGDPNNRKVARVSLRFEFRWDTKAPLIAASLGYQVEVTFPPRLSLRAEGVSAPEARGRFAAGRQVAGFSTAAAAHPESTAGALPTCGKARPGWMGWRRRFRRQSSGAYRSETGRGAACGITVTVASGAAPNRRIRRRLRSARTLLRRMLRILIAS